MFRRPPAPSSLLDIFGFENFRINAFPQLCINLTNELLHNLFIGHIIRLEQEVYAREGVMCDHIDFEDNQAVLDLISKRPACIVGLLDDASSTGAGSDATFLGGLHREFGAQSGRRHPSYREPKRGADRLFVVLHYAGEVSYTAEGFVDMNKDELSAGVTALCLEKTGLEHLRLLAAADAQRKTEEAGSGGSKGRARSAKRRKTVAKAFGESIEAGTFDLENATSVEITEEDAAILNKMFEELTETNSKEMWKVMVADEAGYSEILGFAKNNL